MAPVQVISRDADSGVVRMGDRSDRVSLLMCPEVEVGDWVLVNAGIVARRLDSDQAAAMSKAFAQVFGPSG